MDYDIYPGTQTPRELEAERAFEQRLARARAADGIAPVARKCLAVRRGSPVSAATAAVVIRI